MEPKELLDILHVASRLKTNTRHCYTEENRKESVADHSWRIALMAMLLEDDFQDININKVIKMCLIHDLGEAFTGDIPTFIKTDENTKVEDQIFQDWVNNFNNKTKERWLNLLDEMNGLQTKEAKLYKALDKMEAVISHNESDIKTWLPLEYDLQLTYGKEEVAFSDYMGNFKKAIDHETIQKIKNAKGEL